MLEVSHVNAKGKTMLSLLDGFAMVCRMLDVHPLLGFAGLIIVASIVCVSRNPRTYCGN